MPQTKYIGQPHAGLTNAELVAGRGTFVDDIQLPGMLYCAVVRSPHAHARIRSIDSTDAESIAGVVAVITGAEISEVMNPITEAYDTAAMGAKQVKWYSLCPEKARFVGEAVAAVVADDKYTAYQACELINVDYEVLPAVTDPEEALKADAPLLVEEWGDNVLVTRDFVVGEPDQAFGEADGTVSGIVQSNRVTGTAIEPRGVVAEYDPYKDLLTVWSSTQNPHPLRTYLAETLRMSENRLRVIQPHVGGGFGLKQPTFQEEPLLAYLALKLRRPVKWIEERSENFQVGGHARDTRFYYEAAYKKDGTVTGVDLRVIADIGAPSALCGWGMSFVTWYCLPTVYRIKNVRMKLHSVVTNKCPWNAYRGYGKDAASFVMERVMDHVARVTETDRAEIRFKNFIQPDEFPYPQASGAVFDSGNYPQAMKTALQMIGYEDFRGLQEEARREGRHIGIGIAQELTPEGCSMPGSVMLCGYDGTSVRIGPTGQVLVHTGVTSPGSGNETGIAAIIADQLGIDIRRIKVIQGDTESCPYGLGNYSSRSVIMGGSAAHEAATELREKIQLIASKMLEAAPGDLDVAEERIFVEGSPERFVTFEEVVTQAYRHTHGAFMDDIEPALEATRHFKIGNVYHQPEKQGRLSSYPTWPSASAAAIVEVDPETGYVKILRYALVHDSGKIINPLLADANLQGGITQGIGGAMYEQLAYDEAGQPLTATFMDYTIPTAMETLNYEIAHQETPSPFTPLGTKGVGESGVGGTLGSLCSAVENAFPELDVRITHLPLTPNRVWEAIREAREREPTGGTPVSSERNGR
jgi:aerobic carbon-monoxide dehydrogenase large subunit